MIATEVDVVTVVVVIEKFALVAPASTVTDAGTTAAALLLESETTTPPVGAAEVRVTVPLSGLPPITGLVVTVTLLMAGGGGLIVSATVLLTPASEAVSVTPVEVATLPMVTVKVADVDPAGITTLAGTLAAEVLLLERKTVKPPVEAAAVEVTVPVAVPGPAMVVGLTENVLRTGGGFTVIPNVVLLPPKVAVKVTAVELLTVPAVTRKVCVVVPCGTVTDAGRVAAFVLELVSVTVAPGGAAAPDNVRVPAPVVPLTIVDGVTTRLLGTTGAGLTVTPVVTLTPENEAVIVTAVATLTVPAVRMNVVEVEPAGTVTLAGIVAPAGDELSATVAPPVNAADDRLTVQIAPPDGDTEVGLHATLLKPGVCEIVMVPFVADTGTAVPLASAAELPLS